MIKLDRSDRKPCHGKNCDVSADWRCPYCGKNWCIVCCYWNVNGLACRPCVQSMVPDYDARVDGWKKKEEALENTIPPAQPADEEEEVVNMLFCEGCKRLVPTDDVNASGGCRSCSLKLFKCKVEIKQLLCDVCNARLPTMEATSRHRRWCGSDQG
jgi:hypothetical protein